VVDVWWRVVLRNCKKRGPSAETVSQYKSEFCHGESKIREMFFHKMASSGESD
jgi:hypothetical protein